MVTARGHKAKVLVSVSLIIMINKDETIVLLKVQSRKRDVIGKDEETSCRETVSNFQNGIVVVGHG